jgi:hypothetical protein
MRPSYPSSKPITLQPLATAVFVTATIAAFIPGASPPDVNIAINDIVPPFIHIF